MGAFPERAGDVAGAGLSAPGAALVEEGLTRFDAKDPRGAMACFLLAHQAAPQDPRALACIAGLHGIALEHDRALAFFRQAIDARPERVRTWTSYGYALIAAGRDAEAVGVFQRAADLAPRQARPLLGLGEALGNLGQSADALATLVRAQAIEPFHPTARFLESLIRLQLGDLVTGFERYESRFEVDRPRYERIDQGRVWQGEPLAGKRVLVASEQGYGDLFQFLRFVPMLTAQGATVIVEARASALPLLREIAGVAEVVEKGADWPPHDVEVPLMSLAHRCQVTPSTVPWSGPYIPARRTGRSERLRVGIAWRGSPTNTMDARRSMPLALFAPVLAVENIHPVCLQMGLTRTEIEWLVAHGVREALPDGVDFKATRDVVASLDLVISVDTAIVHLAGAMGWPVWPLLCHSPDWRWQLERSDSPWYPTARLFRQASYGDWTHTLSEVTEALARLAAEHRPAQAVRVA